MCVASWYSLRMLEIIYWFDEVYLRLLFGIQQLNSYLLILGVAYSSCLTPAVLSGFDTSTALTTVPAMVVKIIFCW